MSLAATLPAPRALAHRAGILALHLLALFLFVAPRVGVKLGPVPLYAVDLLAATVLLAALLTPRQTEVLPFCLGVLMTLVVLGEFYGGVSMGLVLEPVYAAGRLLVALSLAYAVAVLVRDSGDVTPILKAATLGILVTSALMVLSSLPATRGFVADLFAHPMLEPAAARTVERLGESEGSIRGRSLIGVSIVSATVLNVAFPLAALLAGASRGIWRALAHVALVAAPLGVAMSYSRSAYLGFALVIAGTVMLRGRGRKTLLATLCLGALALGLGAGGDALLVSRLETRVAAMIENPLANERESERLLAYAEPFVHAAHHPRFLLIGEGSVAERYGIVHQSGKATHAVFAKAFYGFGLVAAVLFAGLPFLLLGRLWALRRTPFGAALFIAALPLVPYFLFDHGAISAPASLMLVGLLFGLATSADPRRFV